MPARAVALSFAFLCLASSSVVACDRAPKPAAKSAAKSAQAPKAEAPAAKADAAEPPAAEPKAEQPTPEPEPEAIVLSDAKLASSTSCGGQQDCVDKPMLELVQAHANSEGETSGEVTQLQQTTVTSSDAVSLHWLTYELPLADEGAQYDALLCYTAIEQREGAPPKQLAHACGAECMPGGELVDLIGSDLPELVTYCRESNIDSVGSIEVYGLAAGGWTKLTRYTPVCGEDDAENESHYSFSREGVVLRCRNIDAEGEMTDAPPLSLKWNGSSFAPA